MFLKLFERTFQKFLTLIQLFYSSSIITKLIPIYDLWVTSLTSQNIISQNLLEPFYTKNNVYNIVETLAIILFLRF